MHLEWYAVGGWGQMPGILMVGSNLSLATADGDVSSSFPNLDHQIFNLCGKVSFDSYVEICRLKFWISPVSRLE